MGRPLIGRARLAAAASLIVATVAVAFARTGQSDDRPRVWIDSVRTHTPGRSDQAASTLASWSNSDLAAVVARAARLSPEDLAQFLWPDDPDIFLRRAITLHTDVAVLSHAGDGYRLPPAERAAIGIADGQRHAVRSGTVHWALARQLVGLLSHPGSDPFARRWYAATSAQLQTWSEYSELTSHLPEAMRLFGDDARLLLYRAAMHEDYASPRIQSATGNAPAIQAPLGPFSALTRPPPGPDVTHPKGYELNQAEADLHKALALEPSLPEVSLRLGHVLGENGRHTEAAAALVSALAMPGLTVALQYDGWLLLGRERSALGDVSGARDALARAAALVPEAQSARIALSQIARASGDRRGAVDALQPLSTDLQTDDPWWAYAGAHAPTPETLLNDLRRTLER